MAETYRYVQKAAGNSELDYPQKDHVLRVTEGITIENYIPREHRIKEEEIGRVVLKLQLCMISGNFFENYLFI